MKGYLVGAFALLSAVCAQANEWHAYYGLNSDEYQAKFDELVDQGYVPNSVNGYERDGEANYAVIFEQKKSEAWISHHGLTFDAYDDKFEEYLAEGYRVRQVNGYTICGVDYYAAIWDKAPSNAWQSWTGMSAESMQEKFDEFLAEGYKLTHVSGYDVDNEARFAGVWEKIDDGVAWWSQAGLNSDEFQSAFDSHVADGYRLVDVDGYQVDGQAYYAAIFDKSASGAWIARSGIDSATFQKEFDQYVADGYVLKTFNGYNVGTEVRFAGIWEQPS